MTGTSQTRSKPTFTTSANRSWITTGTSVAFNANKSLTVPGRNWVQGQFTMPAPDEKCDKPEVIVELLRSEVQEKAHTVARKISRRVARVLVKHGEDCRDAQDVLIDPIRATSQDDTK